MKDVLERLREERKVAAILFGAAIVMHIVALVVRSRLLFAIPPVAVLVHP